MRETGIVERAFALARTGNHKSLTTIRPVLKKEGFIELHIEEHLGGGGIRRELRDLCKANRRPTSDAVAES